MKPLVVHSLGKCASRTIYLTVKHAGYPAYFVHYLAESGRFNGPMVRKMLAKGVEMYTIVPVREPVERNLSAFFGNLECFGNDPSLENFLRSYPHDVPERWFQDEFPVWGVDVFAQPFNRARGWQIYDGRLLIIRVDALACKWEAAFTALTGQPALPLTPKVNTNGLGAYKKFLKTGTVPADYIGQMHATRYYRHFFAQAGEDQ